MDEKTGAPSTWYTTPQPATTPHRTQCAPRTHCRSPPVCANNSSVFYHFSHFPHPLLLPNMRHTHTQHHRFSRESSNETEYFSTSSSPALDAMDGDPTHHARVAYHPEGHQQDANPIDSDSEEEDIIFTGYSAPPARAPPPPSSLPPPLPTRRQPASDDNYFVGPHGPLGFVLDLRWKDRLGCKVEVSPS